MPIFRSDGSQLAPQLSRNKTSRSSCGPTPKAFVGADLFPVCRQGRIATGGIPDVIALDKTGRVVIFEVKRSLDRNQLAQSLECAGWSRTAASMTLRASHFRNDTGAFFADGLRWDGPGPVVNAYGWVVGRKHDEGPGLGSSGALFHIRSSGALLSTSSSRHGSRSP